MSYPSELKYTKDHEWIKLEGKVGIVGVTSYAVEQLGDVVYLELPKVGQTFKENETFGTIESTKTVSDLFCPVSGKVVEVNQKMIDSPELLANDVYKEGWLIKLEVSGENKNLLSASDYESYIAGH